MRLLIWIACFWPGLAQAWRLGSVRGLGLAIAFAAGLNLALVCSLVWPRWPVASLPAGSTAAIVWVWVLGLWIVGIRWTARSWRELCPPRASADPQIDDWFREAQHEYLKGHWIEAESLLTRLLARQPADVEARLLLASVQRRRSNRDQAKRTLTELQAAAPQWQLEIDTELKQLEDPDAEECPVLDEPARKAA